MTGYKRITFLKIFGARVHVHWSVFIVMGGILMMSYRHPVLAPITICSYLGILLLHESGHAFVAGRLGYRSLDIYLGFLHGLCCFQAPETRKDEAIIAWGGVLAQFAVAIPLIVLAQTISLGDVPGMGPVVAFLGYLSALTAFVNLAPSRALDGGKAWALFPILWAERRKPKKRGSVTKGPWSPRKD
ncbi:hypothetical protein [Arenimonas oryziterrae]|uniref:Peptidase M50 domain-containing protein n=1 Tax=Arenimonas oryziterrae DSM 21050 = YC6267 TaxID=1121015 RepID=A0A091AZL9_9GAMM|nr:hypothetical protein [Arenimonas oryziterrae]KFN44752.1 hypothetical protein N789_01700 [Arenimonas oryziterrae DSM 21050 = YC6267]